MGRAPAVLPDGLFFRWFGGRGDGSAIAENWSRATDRGAHRLQLPGRLESSGALEGPATALPSSRGPNRTRGKGPGFFGGASRLRLRLRRIQAFARESGRLLYQFRRKDRRRSGEGLVRRRCFRFDYFRGTRVSANS